MDDELNAEETEKLVQFQELSGIEDLNACKQILRQHSWNVESAIHFHLNLSPDHRSEEPARSFPQNGSARANNTVSRRNLSTIPSLFQRISSFLFESLPENSPGLWILPTGRPQGFVGWVIFLSYLPLRIALLSVYHLTGYVWKIIQPNTRPAVTDPTTDVTTFISQYDAKYGSAHPRFFVGTYNQVLNEAKKELKFLLVYLHCRDHQDTDRFCRGTLADPEVIRYIDDNCLMWACSVDFLEGYRVSQALRENTYPFVAVVVQRDFRMTVVGRIEGYVSSREFLQRIQAIVADNEAFLVAARVDREERSFNQALRQEQDEAYLESLRADREKEEKKRRERQLLEEQERERRAKEEAEKRHRDQLMQRKLDAVHWVPDEPAADEAGCCRILVRLPKGQKLERRFNRERHTLKDLYYFILAHPDSPYRFEMATSFPKRTLSWNPSNQQPADQTEAHLDAPTLAQVGLGASEAILVLDLDA